MHNISEFQFVMTCMRTVGIENGDICRRYAAATGLAYQSVAV